MSAKDAGPLADLEGGGAGGGPAPLSRPASLGPRSASARGCSAGTVLGSCALVLGVCGLVLGAVSLSMVEANKQVQLPRCRSAHGVAPGAQAARQMRRAI